MLLGIAFKLISTLAFTFMSACVKLIGAWHPGDPLYFPVGQTVFCRSFFALIPVFIWLAWKGDLMSAFRTDRPWDHDRRGAYGSVGMFAGLHRLILLPLADATAISYAAPLFTVVLAAILLKEQVRIYRWTAVGVGFVGVLVMLAALFRQSRTVGGRHDGGRGLRLAGRILRRLRHDRDPRLTETRRQAPSSRIFMMLTTLIGLTSISLGLFLPSFAWKWTDAARGRPAGADGHHGWHRQIT